MLIFKSGQCGKALLEDQKTKILENNSTLEKEKLKGGML